MRNLGDKVWVATVKSEKKPILCSVCFGNKTVTLILGNGDHVELECQYCSHGFMPATGYSDEWHYLVGDAEFTKIWEINIEADGITYRTGTRNAGRIVPEDMIADTCAEAMRLGELLAGERNEERKVKEAKIVKEKEYKTYAWNAGYYLRMARRAEADAIRYYEKAKVMRSKVR